jgi:hypothetical protein
MKKYTLFISILLIVQSAIAQSTFQKTIGGTNLDRGYAVQQTADAGYIITGSYSVPAAVFSDVYLVKTDSSGNLLWTKTFGGSNNDLGRYVQQTFDGGYIIVGTTSSFGAGDLDMYLIRTDANGDSLWTKTFGGAGSDEGFFIQQTTDSGYIFIGRTSSFSLAGDLDFYLVKTDVNGNILWTKTLGGANHDEGFCVKQTTDGGYIITGRTWSFGAGNSDVYSIKTDVNGNPLWSKTYGGTSSDESYSIQQTTDGGYIISGQTSSFGAGIGNVYLLKTDASGNVLWQKTFGGTSQDYGYQVQETTDGGYIILGITQSFASGINDIYLIKTDLNGDTLWTKTFGGTNDDYSGRGQQTADGGYIIVGSTMSFGAGYYDVYLVKTDANGNTGCNELSPPTIAGTPASQITSPVTIAGSTLTIVTSPATVINSGGILTTLCIVSGKDETTIDNNFNIFPNPSSGIFVISSGNLIKEGKITLLNLPGEVVAEKNIYNESREEINIKNISAGIYFVKVLDGEKSYCRKIIIE